MPYKNPYAQDTAETYAPTIWANKRSQGQSNLSVPESSVTPETLKLTADLMAATMGNSPMGTKASRAFGREDLPVYDPGPNLSLPMPNANSALMRMMETTLGAQPVQPAYTAPSNTQRSAGPQPAYRRSGSATAVRPFNDDYIGYSSGSATDDYIRQLQQKLATDVEPVPGGAGRPLNFPAAVPPPRLTALERYQREQGAITNENLRQQARSEQISADYSVATIEKAMQNPLYAVSLGMSEQEARRAWMHIQMNGSGFVDRGSDAFGRSRYGR